MKKIKTYSRRDAQVQSMQTIIIAVFMFMIIGIALLFYFKISKSHTQKKVEEIRVLKGLELINRWQKLPEFSCPSFGAEINPCMDIEKVKAFNTIITRSTEAKAFYSSLFGNVNVEIEKLDINKNENETIKIYNNIPAQDEENIMALNIPINIYDPILNKKYFGVMNIFIGVTSGE